MESISMKKSNWHGGKGSTPRTNTHSKEYQDNWETIFGKGRPNINTRDKEVKNGNNTTDNKKS